MIFGSSVILFPLVPGPGWLAVVHWCCRLVGGGGGELIVFIDC